ncbi:MAG TPA: hypothetical protein VHI51_16770 [Ktedonobacterales bacterium]|nr:hypothetical protein [Ktedonobacterales bacterium]
MKGQRFGWIGWLIMALCFCGIAVSSAIFLHIGATIDSGVALNIAFLAFPLVGAIIVSRRITNTVGWLFCLVGLGTTFTSFAASFIQYALLHHLDGQVAAGLIDIFGDLVWPLNLVLGVFILYLFPDGRALTRRWRVVVWLLAALLFIVELAQAVAPGPLEADNRVPNPLGVPALAGFSFFVSNYLYVLLPVFALLAVVSLILRFRRAGLQERQQIKWFVFGAVVMVVIVGIGYFFSAQTNDPKSPLTALGNVLFAVGITALPLGVGIGVLRYRLYDIDILIKRTLVYGSLTAILAALYFGLVIGAQQLTHQFTGHDNPQQPVVIVLTTLLIAALFTPLRARLQRWIDRRFDRSHYDAAKTLAAFSASLRSEINAQQLHDHLLDVVEETMRPSSVTLWLRPASGRSQYAAQPHTHAEEAH